MNDEIPPPQADEPEPSSQDSSAKPRKRKAKVAPKKKKAVKKILDPLGDPSDGEAQFATGAEIEVSEAAGAAEQASAKGEVEAPVLAEEAQGEPDKDAAVEEIEETEPRPAPRLERLQKILAQAGVASRRHAEELITEGRVQVNGQVVTVLGSKADVERDHIRVDGKLLHGAERLRYFVLNKPRGYVTTVTDPEGRPTVMQFFSKLGERLYPVGRLDFQSEGLLLVTNDGALANQLTRAASGVEKTYLVKVSGKPDEERLQGLREGVSIERGRPGEGKVRTAPARIRQIRPGDNPWYEVVLIEGRNRELRKMFEEIGHHVEKIRRVGYGPLALDVPPGKVRELDQREVEALRQTAEGKYKPRRVNAAHMLPKEAGIPAEERAKARGKKTFRTERFEQKGRPGSRPSFRERGVGGFEQRGQLAGGFGRAPGAGRPSAPARDFGGARGGGFSRRGEGAGGFRPERGEGRPRSYREEKGGPEHRREFGGRREGGFAQRGERAGGFGRRREGTGGVRLDRSEGRPRPYREEKGRPEQRREFGGRREGGFARRGERAGGFGRRREGAEEFQRERGAVERRPDPSVEGKPSRGQGRESRPRFERGARGPAEGRKPFFRGRSERPAEGGADQRRGSSGPRRDARPDFKGGARREEKRGGRGPNAGRYGGKGRTAGGQRSQPSGGKRPGGRNAGPGRKGH